MTQTEQGLSDKAKITKLNFLWMSLSQEPMVALYALLPFILAKDLGASALEVSLFMAIRPISSVFSYYWHAFQHTRHPNLRIHLMVAWGLSFTAFLFLPRFSTLGYVMLAASCFQLFSKAAMPPFYEIFKQNLDQIHRKRLISYTYLASFVISACLGLFFGQLLDTKPGSWKIAASIFSALALSSLFFQKKLSFDENKTEAVNSSDHFLFAPLKKSFAILKSSKDFRDFQVGFMIGGSALMLIGPALSIFYADTLELTHKSYTQARYIFMSFGVIATTPLWQRALKHYSINQIMPYVSLIFGLFPLVVISSFFHKPIVNAAFVLYGIAQAGSHLIWNMSGPVFSKDADSSPYTALNILMQGLRGCIAPIMGGVLTSLAGPIFVLVLGSLLGLYGMYVMFGHNQKRANNP